MKISQRFLDTCKKDHKPGERRFICDVIRRFIDSDSAPIRSSEDLDWGWIDLFLKQENLKPLFYLVLEKARLEPARLHAWQRERMAYLRRTILINQTAAALFSNLERNHIPAAALRGLHLANFFYPDAGVRPMRDVDILVQASRDQVRAALRPLAGQPQEVLRTQDTFIIDQIIFEIHYSYLTTKRFRSALATDSFLETRRQLRTAEGQKLVCLTAENELIGVVAHGFIHHGLDRMMHLVDAALLMNAPMLDWDFLLAWCKRTKLCKMFHFAFSLVDHLFGLQHEKMLERFEDPLPPWAPAAFEAYACRLWGWDSRQADLLRRRVQLEAAETIGLKWQQMLRFLSTDELRTFVRLLVRKEVTQKIGLETVHDFEAANEHRDESRN